MSVSRMSTNYAFIRSMNNISDSFMNLDELREKMNTGKNVNRPSQDPIALQKIYALNSSLARNDQYQSNVGEALRRLNTTSTTLTRIEEVLNEIYEIAVNNSSSVVTSAEMATAAQEVELLLEEVIQLANTKYRDKFIFGGAYTTSGAAALSAAYTIGYGANSYISGVAPNSRGINTLLYTTILPGMRETMNISGAAPFQPNGAKGSNDIFNAIVNLRENLLSADGNAVSASEDSIANAIKQVTEQNSFVGAKINKLEITQDTLEYSNTSETGAKSNLEDADYARLLIEYQTAEVLLNTVLSSTATLLQNSLINFI